MDHRFTARLDEMMDQAEVSPELLRDLLPRLNQFVQPFVKNLLGPEQIRHAAEYIMGLVSKLDARPAKGSPTSTISNAKASRSSSDTCRGLTNRCSPPWPDKSARSWAKSMV